MVRQVIPKAMKISCKEASRLISQSMDERLSFPQRVKLRVHLLICDACYNFNRNMRLLRQAVARLFEQ
jgi:hypothetical protein